MKKATINGKDFYDYLRFGAEEVYSGKDDLNRINVFPVKDGDTGTNLALTINSIVDETEISEDFNVVIQSMSDAAFESARGNSGIIFASFLNGFSSACGQLRTVSMEDFSNGATLAVQEAYAAVASPVEGTMLTVIREWADYIRDNHSKHNYFSDLLEAAYARAKIALEETPEKLEVLKKSKVVDSGAKGFVLFLSGINRLLSEIKAAAFSDKTVSEKLDVVTATDGHGPDLVYRYCTEILLKESIQNKGLIETLLQDLGDSMIITGNERLVKIHIHTNAPDQVTKILVENHHHIAKSKVDDMRIQKSVEENRKSKIGILTDSIADISQELIEREQIHVLSLGLIADESVYLDKLTVTQENIQTILDYSKTYPSSTQADLKQIKAKLEWMTAHYEGIVIVSVASALSGMYSNYKAAIKEYTDKGYDIRLIDSKLNSSAEGMMALKAAQMANAGDSIDEIVTQIESEVPRTDIYVSLDTLKYAVKGGRVPNVLGKFLMRIGAKAIMTLKRSGEGTAFGLAFSRKQLDAKIMKHVSKIMATDGIERYSLVHAGNPKCAAEYAEQFTQIVGKPPEYITPISAITTIHSGIGSVAISLVRGKANVN